MNLKSRRDYLPTHYINGVESITEDKTQEGIRALTEEEKDWLNQFNKEFVGASFSKNDEDNLHKTSAKVEKKVNKLKGKIKEIKNNIKRMEASTKKYSDEVKKEYKKLHKLEEERLAIDGKKQCYDANNDRNRCTHNVGKMINKVKYRTMDELDQNIMHMDEFENYFDMYNYYNIQLKPDEDE
jgi:phage shock protein A